MWSACFFGHAANLLNLCLSVQIIGVSVLVCLLFMNFKFSQSVWDGDWNVYISISCVDLCVWRRFPHNRAVSWPSAERSEALVYEVGRVFWDKTLI